MSTPTFPAPPLTPAPPATHRISSQRRRPTFLLPSDGESDRDREQREGENAHDDSDDSDRTSFFSAEEFLVPANAPRDAGTAEGKVLDVQTARHECHGQGRQYLDTDTKSEAKQNKTLERIDVVRDNEERDAAHGLRRWHALMEIVHTEAGYVRDLRALVNVYLALLPSLPLSPPTHGAIQELSREASGLLALHERFSLALRDASAQAAGKTSSVGKVDEAVRQVAGLFIEEASTFDLYQRFCSAQPDTLHLLRSVQTRPEWTAFERRCMTGGDTPDSEPSALPTESREIESPSPEASPITPASAPASTSASTLAPPLSRRHVPPRTLSLMPSAFKVYASSSTSHATNLAPNHRRHSYDSLAAVFGASGSATAKQKPVIFQGSSVDFSTTAMQPSASSSRLRFHDFLIKPVQRICKYPLMLEGLRSQTHGGSVDTAVARAVDSMRAVAMRVDDARRRREAAARSKLIAERIEPHVVVQPEFIRSLGDCFLAGSLDVVHHHHVLHQVTMPVRVRYLGAFLYLGGYLLLVKVDKGKSYRIKHWFPLASFELVDIPQDSALVPCSFRLSYMDHHFEIAAACQREKDLWMRAINEARCIRPSWNFEPVPSLQTSQAEISVSLSATDANAPESAGPATVLERGSSSSSLSESSNPLAILRLSSTRNRISASNPTVRYIFSLNDDSSILLKRSSSTNRLFVDRGLVDVFSDLVFNLRQQAQLREETLFPPPHFSDTMPTIGIAAKNKLMRRGSMLVARPRNMLIPSSATGKPEEDVTCQPPSTVRHKPGPGYCRRMSLIPALSVLYTDPQSISGGNSTACSTDLKVPRSGPNFNTFHTPSGAMSLPTSPMIDNPGPDGTDKHSNNHRRARSLVGSMKNLVRRATTRTISTPQAADSWQALRTPDQSFSDVGESTECSSKASVGRRRVSSAPTSPPLLSTTSVIFPDSDPSSPPIFPPLDGPITQVDPSSPPPATSASKHVDKKFGSIRPHPDHTLKPRRSLKSFVFYNRLTAVEPA